MKYQIYDTKVETDIKLPDGTLIDVYFQYDENGIQQLTDKGSLTSWLYARGINSLETTIVTDRRAGENEYDFIARFVEGLLEIANIMNER